MGLKIGIDSLTVLYVTFKDGNIRTFYSRDWDKPEQKVLKKQTGINRLVRLADRYQSDDLLLSAILKEKETGLALQTWPRSSGSNTVPLRTVIDESITTEIVSIPWQKSL